MVCHQCSHWRLNRKFCRISGRRESYRARQKIRAEEMDVDCATSKRPDREAMPRTLAQPPKSEHQEERLDGSGGPGHLPGAPRMGQPVGEDSQTTSGKVRVSTSVPTYSPCRKFMYIGFSFLTNTRINLIEGRTMR